MMLSNARLSVREEEQLVTHYPYPLEGAVC